jgi:hypothetical protein
MTTYTLIDQYEVGSVDNENKDIINLLINGISTLINKYSDLLSDPNIATSLLNKDIDEWNIKDVESIKGALALVGLRLVITDETQEDVVIKEKSVMYLGIDSSFKKAELIPAGQYTLEEYKPNIDVLSNFRKVIPDMFFNSNKFLNNPIESLLGNCLESKQLSGVYDAITIDKLFRLLKSMNFEILTIVITPEN